MVWDTLRELAPKRYLAILHLAAIEGEARVDDAIRGLLEAGEIAEGKLTADSVRAVLMAENMVPPPTQIAVADVVLASFDELLGSIAQVAAAIAGCTMTRLARAGCARRVGFQKLRLSARG